MHLSEQRARVVARELLSFRGWDLRPVSSGGQLLEESEYRAFPHLVEIFNKKSKTGPGFGKPDFLLVDSASGLRPLVVIDTKPQASDINRSILDTNHYGDAIRQVGQDALSVAVAGADREICAVKVQRNILGAWRDLTLHNRPIDWIPSPGQTQKILSISGYTEVAPERPPDHVLAEQANRLNEILRECKIKDEFRPIYAAAFMLGTWYADVSTDSAVVLEQINTNASRALKKADKADLASSLRVDSENEDLALKAWEIVDILKKLNIRSFVQEHDYLGQLYETFFRYTGGNTIGQYFTPRHIIDMMCELIGVTPNDTVFDPACGTGGFLIGALRRMIRLQHLTYEEGVSKIKDHIFGIESEPSTAALCITNMILRGDGKSGIIRANCFTKTDYPEAKTDIALLNPPFPHDKKTDIPPTKFVDRAALSVRNKGLVSSIVPYSLLVRTGDWHRSLLKNNRLLLVATMTGDAFQPYASFDTAVIMFQKGVPHDNSKVFFARVANDGYKVKKNIRIPQPGSQIPTIIAAYGDKKEIPELTAYSQLTETSKEWSPEAFIASAAHSDEEFIKGLEQSVRNQAAFYISDGHRIVGKLPSSGTAQADAVFAGRSDISLSDVVLGPFLLSQYFDIQLGGRDEIEDLTEDGNVPIVSTSEFSNGVTAWRTPNVTYAPPAITVATDGSTCSSFVQEAPFYAFYKVAILKPKAGQDIPIDALYFVAYQLSMERWRYVYARKFGKGRLSTTTLYGPWRGGRPDFHKMADIVRACGAYPLIASFRAAYRKFTGERFSELSARWKSERRATSSVSRMVSHPAYQMVIDLGIEVVPSILAELAASPDHWFVALNRITGADPVPIQDRGKLDRMAQAWIEWGRDRGLLSA
jgi:type I restriction-modification system DNA methylase subunit